MRNLKITNHMKKITYSNISKEKLDEFFSSGYNKRLKDNAKVHTLCLILNKA